MAMPEKGSRNTSPSLARTLDPVRPAALSSALRRAAQDGRDTKSEARDEQHGRGQDPSAVVPGKQAHRRWRVERGDDQRPAEARRSASARWRRWTGCPHTVACSTAESCSIVRRAGRSAGRSAGRASTRSCGRSLAIPSASRGITTRPSLDRCLVDGDQRRSALDAERHRLALLDARRPAPGAVAQLRCAIAGRRAADRARRGTPRRCLCGRSRARTLALSPRASSSCLLDRDSAVWRPAGGRRGSRGPSDRRSSDHRHEAHQRETGQNRGDHRVTRATNARGQRKTRRNLHEAWTLM